MLERMSPEELERWAESHNGIKPPRLPFWNATDDCPVMDNVRYRIPLANKTVLLDASFKKPGRPKLPYRNAGDENDHTFTLYDPNYSVEHHHERKPITRENLDEALERHVGSLAHFFQYGILDETFIENVRS